MTRAARRSRHLERDATLTQIRHHHHRLDLDRDRDRDRLFDRLFVRRDYSELLIYPRCL
jgi:hypothetical protein